MLYLLNEISLLIKQTKLKNSKNQANISNLFHLAIQTNDYFSLLTSKNFIVKIFTEDLSYRKLILFKNLYQITNLTTLLPYLIQFSLFATFININNGIVVGDRSNHEVSFHVCQLFYFSIFTFSLLFLSHVFQSFKNFIKLIKTAFFKNFLLVLIFLGLINLVIDNFTYEHMFLLSDNRHYTFYVWSKIFKRHSFVKYLLSPIYYLSIVSLYKLLVSNHKSFGWLVAYTICLCACLIPQKLLEFRYFIIPYIIYRLNIRNYSIKFLFIEIFIYSFINSVTIYLFLYKTFYWKSNDEIQRFMW
jgi:alpha-1,2-glucosyltransferase